MIRNGTRIIRGEFKYEDPELDGFETIVCVAADQKYKELSPFLLKDSYGHVLENIWQFSKVYETVPEMDTKEWKHPAERHYDKKTKQLTEEYWKWREKGMNSERAIRFPVKRENSKKSVATLLKKGEELVFLNYIEARKQLYIPLYCQAVKQTAMFKHLQQNLSQGKNLLLVDYDGPKQNSLSYYKDKYRVTDNFIFQNTIEANAKNLSIMLHDDKHSFGHAYCLSLALLGLDEKIHLLEETKPKNTLYDFFTQASSR